MGECIRKQIFEEDFLQHRLQVVIETDYEREPLDFIPDAVKEEILNQLADSPEGEFKQDETGYDGKWRIFKLDHHILYILGRWTCYQRYPEHALTEADFIKYMGETDGKSIFECWINNYNCDFLKMATLFTPGVDTGQKFCDMVAEKLIYFENEINNYLKERQEYFDEADKEAFR